MNQELKQRLIGAVVVTALAAIFIPMLFDDPVDNSGQSVSELVIPATPVNTGEESANKLPTSANQVLNAPDSGSEKVVNTEEEAELSADNQLSQDASLNDEPEADMAEGDEPAIDVPINDGSSTALDTGVANKTNKSVKTLKALSGTEAAKQQLTQKPPLEAESNIGIDTPKKSVKKTEAFGTKPAEKVNALITSMDNTTDKTVVKPVTSKSELGRWTLQAGTFSKKENAVTLMERLRKQGLPVTMEVTKGAGNTTLYRIKVGPTLDKKRALEMKAKMDSQKIQSLLVAE
ncbi:MAG: SPOR domain-containing protein [Methylococcaceae bacterium]